MRHAKAAWTIALGLMIGLATAAQAQDDRKLAGYRVEPVCDNGQALQRPRYFPLIAVADVKGLHGTKAKLAVRALPFGALRAGRIYRKLGRLSNPQGRKRDPRLFISATLYVHALVDGKWKIVPLLADDRNGRYVLGCTDGLPPERNDPAVGLVSSVRYSPENYPTVVLAIPVRRDGDRNRAEVWDIHDQLFDFLHSRVTEGLSDNRNIDLRFVADRDAALPLTGDRTFAELLQEFFARWPRRADFLRGFPYRVHVYSLFDAGGRKVLDFVWRPTGGDDGLDRAGMSELARQAAVSPEHGNPAASTMPSRDAGSERTIGASDAARASRQPERPQGEGGVPTQGEAPRLRAQIHDDERAAPVMPRPRPQRPQRSEAGRQGAFDATVMNRPADASPARQPEAEREEGGATEPAGAGRPVVRPSRMPYYVVEFGDRDFYRLEGRIRVSQCRLVAPATPQASDGWKLRLIGCTGRQLRMEFPDAPFQAVTLTFSPQGQLEKVGGAPAIGRPLKDFLTVRKGTRLRFPAWGEGHAHVFTHPVGLAELLSRPQTLTVGGCRFEHRFTVREILEGRIDAPRPACLRPRHVFIRILPWGQWRQQGGADLQIQGCHPAVQEPDANGQIACKVKPGVNRLKATLRIRGYEPAAVDIPLGDTDTYEITEALIERLRPQWPYAQPPIEGQGEVPGYRPVRITYLGAGGQPCGRPVELRNRQLPRLGDAGCDRLPSHMQVTFERQGGGDRLPAAAFKARHDDRVAVGETARRIPASDLARRLAAALSRETLESLLRNLGGLNGIKLEIYKSRSCDHRRERPLRLRIETRPPERLRCRDPQCLTWPVYARLVQTQSGEEISDCVPPSGVVGETFLFAPRILYAGGKRTIVIISRSDSFRFRGRSRALHDAILGYAQELRRKYEAEGKLMPVNFYEFTGRAELRPLFRGEKVPLVDVEAIIGQLGNDGLRTIPVGKVMDILRSQLGSADRIRSVVMIYEGTRMNSNEKYLIMGMIDESDINFYMLILNRCEGGFRINKPKYKCISLQGTPEKISATIIETLKQASGEGE